MYEWFMNTPSGLLAAFFYPFFMLALAVLVLLPLRLLAERFIPEGRIKRLLLRRIN